MNIQNSFLLSSYLDDDTKSALNNLLIQATVVAKNLLQQFAAQSNFESYLKLAFGNDIDIDLLKASWTAGEFAFPEIEIVNRADINNANGAFAADANKIYLAQEFLIENVNNIDAVQKIVLEEYGHFIDSQLNVVDALGDEGAIFAALVQGEELRESDLLRLKNENDTAVVVLDGKEVAIEQNDPGNTLATAQNIGVLAGKRNFTNSITSEDVEDIYQFSLDQTSRVNLDLAALNNQSYQSYLDVELIIDRNGNGLIDRDDDLYRSDTRGIIGKENAQISSTLGAANYFIRVERDNDSTNTDYNLTLDASVVPPSIAVDPGKTLATAYNFGILNQEQTVTEFIGTTDAVDIYQFSLDQTSRVNIDLAALNNQSYQSYLDVELIIDRNNNGLIDSDDDLYRSDTRSNFGKVNAQISSTLGAANYFIRVERDNDSTNTDYNLTLDAQSDSSNEPDPRTINLPTNEDKSLNSIRLEFVGGEFAYNEQTERHEASGIIFIGRTDGIKRQIRVDGKVSYDDDTVSVDGTVYSVIGDNNIKQSPLFKGKFELDIATATTKSFEETGSLSNEYEIAGSDIDFKGITFNQENIALNARIKTPDNLGINYNYFTSDTEALLVSQDNVDFAQSFGLSLPDFKNDNLFDFLPIKELSDLSFDYIAEENAIKLQGKLIVEPFINSPDLNPFNRDETEIIVDLAGDNFIQIQDGKADLVGSLEINNLDIGEFFGVDVGLSIDTINKKVGGKAKITYSFGKNIAGKEDKTGIGLDLGFIYSPFGLDRIKGEVDFNNFPIFNTGWNLQEIGLGLDNISSSQPLEVTLDGRVTSGPEVAFLDGLYSLIDAKISATVSSEELTGKGEFKLIDDRIFKATEASFTINWKDRYAELGGKATIVDDFIVGDVDFKLNSNFDISFSSKAQVNIPKSIPVVGGASLGEGNYVANFSNDGDFSNDYYAAWGEYKIRKFGVNINSHFGAKFYPFKKGSIADKFELFGPKDLPPIGSYYIAPDTEWVFLSADWENDRINDVPVIVETPNGEFISEDEFAENNIAIVEKFTNSNTKTVVVVDPEPGIWDILLEDKTGLGEVKYTALGESEAPEVEITLLEQNIDGSEVTINYNAFDADSQAQIKLFYDDDDRDFNGLLITDDLIEADGAGSFTWNTEGIAPGDYHVYAMVMDENSVPSFDYSEQSITISQQADISVTQVANFEPIGIGEELTYTVNVTNNGDVSSKGITLDQTFSSSVISKSFSINPVKQEDNTISFNIGDLEAGKSKQVEITVTAPDTVGDIDSQSTVTSQTFDPDIVNDTAILSTTVAEEGIPIESTNNQPTLDIDGNGILESQDYTLINLYASFGGNAGLFDVFLQSYADVLLGEEATRKTGTEITNYLTSSQDQLFDLDGNGQIETSDYSLLDLYSAFGANSQVLDIFLQQYPDVLLGEEATRTSATEIIDYLNSYI